MTEQIFTGKDSQRVKEVRIDGENVTGDCLQFTASPLPNTPQMGEATLVVRTKTGTIQMNATYNGPATRRVAGMIEWVEKA